MRRISIFILGIYFLLTIVSLASADQIAIAEDGRKVLLKDDGMWEYVKEQKEQEAQSPKPRPGSYIREGSIGKVKERVITTVTEVRSKSPFVYRPIDSWVGENFIFLPTNQDYKFLKSESDKSYNSSNQETWYIILPYEKYVGRIGKVVAVKKNDNSELSFTSRDIDFEMIDSKDKLTIRSSGIKEYLHITLPGIGPVADIDKARELWLNETFWNKGVGETLSTYDVETGKSGSITAKRFSPIKVIDIVAGEDNSAPVRFILQTSSGEEGYLDMNLSGTNASKYYTIGTNFMDLFFTKDPQREHTWSDRIWSAIQDRKVFIGMPAEAVKSSWGEPQDINVTIYANSKREQWIYGSGSYLYFENDVLTSIQQ